MPQHTEKAHMPHPPAGQTPATAAMHTHDMWHSSNATQHTEKAHIPHPPAGQTPATTATHLHIHVSTHTTTACIPNTCHTCTVASPRRLSVVSCSTSERRASSCADSAAASSSARRKDAWSASRAPRICKRGVASRRVNVRIDRQEENQAGLWCAEELQTERQAGG